MKPDIPFIVPFKTKKGNNYIYDVVTHCIFPSCEITIAILKNIKKINKESLFQKLLKNRTLINQRSKKMIKKVSNSQGNSYEIPGAKFKAPVACDWTSCDLQCTCSHAESDQQFYDASHYFANHSAIWN